MKLLFLRAALLLALAIPASAQVASVWKHLQRPDAGGSIRFMSIAESDTTAANDLNGRVDLLGFGPIGGFNLPFVPLADDMSLGLNPNAFLGTYLAMENMALGVELPVYATFKWGTDATWGGSKSWVGATLGAGYNFNVFLPVGWGYGAIAYGIPSVMAEINFGKRRGGLGLIKLRYSLGLGDHREEYTYDGSAIDIFMTQHAFDLIITSGY